MDDFLIPVGAISIVYGYFHYFVNRDALWEQHIKRNGLRRFATTRTEQWDNEQTYVGMIYIIVGIIGVIVAILT